MNRPLCLGCGCDEVHGCPLPLTGVPESSCSWLRFDATARAGICSACEDLVALWDDGMRTPVWEDIAVRFYRQALFLYEAKDAIHWMRTPQLVLQGRTPRELILAGHLEEVQAALDLYRSGAFA